MFFLLLYPLSCHSVTTRSPDFRAVPSQWPNKPNYTNCINCTNSTNCIEFTSVKTLQTVLVYTLYKLYKLCKLYKLYKLDQLYTLWKLHTHFVYLYIQLWWFRLVTEHFTILSLSKVFSLMNFCGTSPKKNPTHTLANTIILFPTPPPCQVLWL